MEAIKIRRLYIMPEVWVTVTHSQVFNWLKLIADKGIPTDCLSITPKNLSADKAKEIESIIAGKFIQVPVRKLILNDLALALILFKYYRKHRKENNKIIFQTRMSSIGLAFRLLKWFTNAKFIFESRAAYNEEEVHVSDGRKINLKKKVKLAVSKWSERSMVLNSDLVFCVSHALKSYYLNKFEAGETNFIVFPGAADSNLFYFNEQIRKEARKELGLTESEILIVYSGRLEMKWEIPDKILSFFSSIYKKDQKFKLLLLTPDVELANNLISEFNLDNAVFVRSVDLEEVNKYLNASDTGLLLREDIVMNNVASPTKFAEYLMAGLPVIISFAIHDFAQNIKETGFGVVVSGLDRIAEDEYKKFKAALKVPRKEIEAWGSEQLSKETFIKKYIQTLRDI